MVRAADSAAEKADRSRTARPSVRRFADRGAAGPGLGPTHIRRQSGDARAGARRTALFVSPIDAIVDVIPVLGLVDDAAVLAWVFRQVRWELDAFREWEGRPLAPA